MAKKVTVATIRQHFQRKRPIVSLTAYDFPSAQLCQRAQVDLVLVGDSLAMTCLGYPDTTRITLDEMLHHCRAVARGAQLPLLVGDLPFGTYHVSQTTAIESAIKMVRDGHMEAVKMEGAEFAPLIDQLVHRVGIPVMGHVGLKPQHKNVLGGYKVQGKQAQGAYDLLQDALKLQEAGCFAVVLEAIPHQVATEITKRLNVPTIGIGAGGGCAGQILVQHDMLGYFEGSPKFVKRFAEVGSDAVDAIGEYCDQVRNRSFPDAKHQYAPMDENEYECFLNMLENSNLKSRE